MKKYTPQLFAMAPGLFELVTQIASMTKDGEDVEGEEFVMENDDAVSTINNLIEMARELIDKEREIDAVMPVPAETDIKQSPTPWSVLQEESGSHGIDSSAGMVALAHNIVDARRIAAAVNACSGIPLYVLESLSPGAIQESFNLVDPFKNLSVAKEQAEGGVDDPGGDVCHVFQPGKSSNNSLSVDLVYQGKKGEYSVQAEKTGDTGIYDELGVSIVNKAGNCVGYAYFLVNEEGKPRVLLTADGDGDGDPQLTYFPLRSKHEAIELD